MGYGDQRWVNHIFKNAKRYLSLNVFVEVIVTSLISLIPLGAIGLIAFVKSNSDGGLSALISAILKPLSTGQLFLYCCGRAAHSHSHWPNNTRSLHLYFFAHWR
jgi:hypothetical protein